MVCRLILIVDKRKIVNFQADEISLPSCRRRQCRMKKFWKKKTVHRFPAGVKLGIICFMNYKTCHQLFIIYQKVRFYPSANCYRITVTTVYTSGNEQFFYSSVILFSINFSLDLGLIYALIFNHAHPGTTSNETSCVTGLVQGTIFTGFVTSM